MKRFRIIVETGYVGGAHEDEVEFEDDYWNSLSKPDQDGLLEDCVQTAISDHIEGHWEEL
jgi:hypothetical protein